MHFKNPAKTSRDTLLERAVWFIAIKDRDSDDVGIGECAPIDGLSLDNTDLIEVKLNEISVSPFKFIPLGDDLLQDFPAIRFALESALLDLKNGGKGHLFKSDFTLGKAIIPINGLIWMGNYKMMSDQIEKKLKEGWNCIKLKIGALDFDRELDLLKGIRKEYSSTTLELRVDANGAFDKNNVSEKLDKLAEFDLHSIEQPIKVGDWEFLNELIKVSPIPIALDEELIPVLGVDHYIRLLEKVKPHYLVLKPSLLGGVSICDRIIDLAKEKGIGCWITSALESNIGLNALAQWVFTKNLKGCQGLGTGQLFTNNIYSPLNVTKGNLSYDPKCNWDYSSILNEL